MRRRLEGAAAASGTIRQRASILSAVSARESAVDECDAPALLRWCALSLVDPSHRRAHSPIVGVHSRLVHRRTVFGSRCNYNRR
jgi:hypothetical protein